MTTSRNGVHPAALLRSLGEEQRHVPIGELVPPGPSEPRIGEPLEHAVRVIRVATERDEIGRIGSVETLLLSCGFV